MAAYCVLGLILRSAPAVQVRVHRPPAGSVGVVCDNSVKSRVPGSVVSLTYGLTAEHPAADGQHPNLQLLFTSGVAAPCRNLLPQIKPILRLP
ncbi:hypothetical protein BDV10DRAFT_172196 [Aspergillus recurvatus]